MSTTIQQARVVQLPRQRTAEHASRQRPRTTVPAAGSGAVRLTRRGRLVVTLTLLAAVTVVMAVFSSWSMATGEAGTPLETRTHVVSEGDTLWAIASEVAEPGDIREVVYEIQKLNSLTGPSLVEGQELAIPVD